MSNEWHEKEIQNYTDQIKELKEDLEWALQCWEKNSMNNTGHWKLKALREKYDLKEGKPKWLF